MNARSANTRISDRVYESLKNDLSSLVGREITIISEQITSTPIKTKVVHASDTVLSIDRSGYEGQLDLLNNGDRVIVQFTYRKQRIATYATISRSLTGRCNLTLSDHVEPLSRRQFKRYKTPRNVVCAILPQTNLSREKIARLRWIKTDSVNFSSGGMMIKLPSQLTEETYLLMHVTTDDKDFPDLIIGQARYSIPAENYMHHVGVKFLVKEQKEKHFPPLILKKIPPKAFEYTTEKRNKLEKKLSETIPEKQE